MEERVCNCTRCFPPCVRWVLSWSFNKTSITYHFILNPSGSCNYATFGAFQEGGGKAVVMQKKTRFCVCEEKVMWHRQHCRLTICGYFGWVWQIENQKQILWWDEQACLMWQSLKIYSFNLHTKYQSDQITQNLKQSIAWQCQWVVEICHPMHWEWCGKSLGSVWRKSCDKAFNVRNTITRHKSHLSLKQGLYMDRCPLKRSEII